MADTNENGSNATVTSSLLDRGKGTDSHRNGKSKVDSNEGAGDDDVSGSEEENTFTKSVKALQSKLEQDSLEFSFLKPICGQILQTPSEKNMQTFVQALDAMENVPVHLSEFVVFPFAVHLKVIRNYKEEKRILIFKTLFKLLEKTALCNSYDMFVNIYQKLHVALSDSKNITTVNSRQGEEEIGCIIDCISSITRSSLGFHIDVLCEPDKVQVFGHSWYILLQLVGPTTSKSIRLKTLDTVFEMVKLCDEKQTRSQVLYKFLPGIISSLRKICMPSATQSFKSIVEKSLKIMGSTIKSCTAFESTDLGHADEMLSQIIELLGKEFVLHKDEEYRKYFLSFCSAVMTHNSKLQSCSKSVSRILLRMMGDSNTVISTQCTTILESISSAPLLTYVDLQNMLHSALSHLQAGNESGVVLSLKEASSVLLAKKLSFIEFQSFLPIVFHFMNELIWKFRNCLTLDPRKMDDSLYVISKKFCTNLCAAADTDEIIYELSSVVLKMQHGSVSNQIGVIITCNNVVSGLVQMGPLRLSEFEAVNLAEVYVSLLDMQSSEMVIQATASDIPALQSVTDLRKAYLLEGLGILGTAYPASITPIVLYSLVEQAGSQNVDIVDEAALLALRNISSPKPLNEFLINNIDFILSEISVRMSSLILYPNCPNAMIFLADYFDFSKSYFSELIDQIFERCTDLLGGGCLQHVYVKVFYAVMNSIWKNLKHEKRPAKIKNFCSSPEGSHANSLLQKLLQYQKSIGVRHPDSKSYFDEENLFEKTSSTEEPDGTEENNSNEENGDDEDEKMDPVESLTMKISHRVLNFLANGERSVKLTAIDCLILGVSVLKNQENALLPLAHTIWQNLIPRFDEKDYVVIRKSFDLLKSLCVSCGTFLRKRTMEEAFPRLSTLLMSLAKESEQIKNKNRQFYTYTQAYKLQLTVLEGMAVLLDSLDVQEFELDATLGGCFMYLKPNQHKNLQVAASKLLQELANGKHSRTIWMKLVNNKLKPVPENCPDPDFSPIFQIP